MKRSLTIHKGPKQQLFLAYLNAEFAKQTKHALSLFKMEESGSIVNVVHTTFELADSQMELVWSFRTLASGVLSEVEVSQASVVGDAWNGAWEEVAREIIDSALRDAYNEKRRMEHRRQVFYYVGTQFDGEYWFRGVRVAPYPSAHPVLNARKRGAKVMPS